MFVMANSAMFCCLIVTVLVVVVIGKPIIEHGDDEQDQQLQQDHHQPDVALINDDGSLDTALINYLFARQMVRRLQSGSDVIDLQRKRNQWRQCAFNAVSCFGRRRK